MSLESQCYTVLNEFKRHQSPVYMQDSLISLFDLTLLDEHANALQIKALAEKAELHKTAAVCILPRHLTDLPQTMSVSCATVINFPSGNESSLDNMNMLHTVARCTQLNEIDYVFPYQLYLDGHPQQALAQCQDMYQLAKQYDLTFKVILETGMFKSLETLFRLCTQLIEMGCDFLKTSTGKIPVGATLPAAFVLLSAIKASSIDCGVKWSGGIKTRAQADDYLHLTHYLLNKTPNATWFRFGASSLLDNLLTDN